MKQRSGMIKQIGYITKVNARDQLRAHRGGPGERMTAWTRAGVREMAAHSWIQESTRLDRWDLGGEEQGCGNFIFPIL